MTVDPVNREVADSELFFAGALRRILKFILLLAAILLAPLVWIYGLWATAGFALGAFVSWLNFRELARSVEAIASRIVDQHSKERGQVIVLRFLLRYVLVAVVAYVIFIRSSVAFRGFLFGVCLPAVAMLIEAGYEGYSAFRRGY